jgi:hypothetical protein
VSPPTTLLIQNADQITQILYFGAGAEPQSAKHAPEWKLWERAKRWLYDEIDVAERDPQSFVHRILWSDGSVLAIPFWDVSIVSVPLRESRAGHNAAAAIS